MIAKRVFSTKRLEYFSYKMQSESTTYHVPALLPEAIEALNIKKEGIYVDATFGGGGHSRAIIEHLDDKGHLYSFDQDRDAIVNSIDDKRFTFVLSNFKYIHNFLKFYGIEQVDGILADLGVSFHHFDSSERGFTFRSEAPLDMRMNRSSRSTAEEVVNTYSDKQLAELFSVYGDLKNAYSFAKAIIKAREKEELKTTTQLVDAVSRIINPRHEKKELAQIFQAIRIEVNGEMDALRKLLEESSGILKENGRIAIITYHSIEDRMVKNFFKSGNISGVIEKDFFGNVETPFKLITRSPITASKEEIDKNPRCRSAKLRVAEKI